MKITIPAGLIRGNTVYYVSRGRGRVIFFSPEQVVICHLSRSIQVTWHRSLPYFATSLIVPGLAAAAPVALGARPRRPVNVVQCVCRFQKHLSFPVGHVPIDKIFYISDEITHNACMIQV